MVCNRAESETILLCSVFYLCWPILLELHRARLANTHIQTKFEKKIKTQTKFVAQFYKIEF